MFDEIVTIENLKKKWLPLQNKILVIGHNEEKY